MPYLQLNWALKDREKQVNRALISKETQDGAKHLKMYQDMKGYADELESAFNGLHGRYTKLKEYYTASDANNQVSSLIFMCVCVCVCIHTYTYMYM